MGNANISETVTEEDLRLAREKLECLAPALPPNLRERWVNENTPFIAAFRAEARREDQTCGCGIYVHPNRWNPEAIHIPDCQYVAKAIQSEREACEREVREVTLPVTNAGVKDPWESGAEWMRHRVLERLRERAK